MADNSALYILTVRKLPEGGFVVAAGSREYGDTQLFASSDITDALDFIENKLTPPAATACKCGASK